MGHRQAHGKGVDDRIRGRLNETNRFGIKVSGWGILIFPVSHIGGGPGDWSKNQGKDLQMKKLLIITLLLAGCATPCPDRDMTVWTRGGHEIWIPKGHIDRLPEIHKRWHDEDEKDGI